MHFSALVVEDDLDLRESLVGILRDAGHDIVDAADGLEALAKLKTRSFDVLITDIDMPRMTGLELAAAVQHDAATSDLPIVFVTAYPEQARHVLHSSTLSKPFSIKALLALVEKALLEKPATKGACDCGHPACPACQPAL